MVNSNGLPSLSRTLSSSVSFHPASARSCFAFSGLCSYFFTLGLYDHVLGTNEPVAGFRGQTARRPQSPVCLWHKLWLGGFFYQKTTGVFPDILQIFYPIANRD